MAWAVAFGDMRSDVLRPIALKKGERTTHAFIPSRCAHYMPGQ